MIDENDSIELTDISIDIKKRIESSVPQAIKYVRLEVNDDKGYRSAALDIRRIDQFKKDLETLRKRAVTPLNNSDRSNFSGTVDLYGKRYGLKLQPDKYELVPFDDEIDSLFFLAAKSIYHWRNAK